MEIREDTEELVVQNFDMKQFGLNILYFITH